MIDQPARKKQQTFDCVQIQISICLIVYTINLLYLMYIFIRQYNYLLLLRKINPTQFWSMRNLEQNHESICYMTCHMHSSIILLIWWSRINRNVWCLLVEWVTFGATVVWCFQMISWFNCEVHTAGSFSTNKWWDCQQARYKTIPRVLWGALVCVLGVHPWLRLGQDIYICWGNFPQDFAWGCTSNSLVSF